MQSHYPEIVSKEVDAVRAAYAAATECNSASRTPA
jgi:hypothetical protein